MLRRTLAAFALASIVGCSANTGFTPLAGSDENAKLAAYAASSTYPSDMKASTDMKVCAIVNNDGKIKLLNFSDQPIRDARVWVNGVFVNHVDTIAAHGSISIKDGEFFDSTGRNFGSAKTLPSKIEIEGRDHLYTVNTASLQ